MKLAKLLSVAALTVSSAAWASPFINLSVKGRVAGSGGDFTKLVSVLPGDTVEYQVWAQMAPIGTSNTQGTTTRTISSLTATTATVVADGIQSLKLDVYQASTDAVQVN